MKESYFLRCEETPFAATYVFLGQTGKRDAVEVDDLIPYLLEDAANDAVLTGVNLQTDMLAVAFRELQGIGDDTLVVQYDTGANDGLIYFVQLLVERDGHSHVTESGRRHDAKRTAYLESQGLKVIRFFDYEVDRDFERVCSHIDYVTKERCAALN